ncbi:alpha-ketoglutarate-dependent dioxygenase AlkB [Megachile rotundata]|uniref:alpha-ketoglutarate-dependent dioxygenase AlkB n=1 Tax=Megachile rotundata TaxID=143995 RepID=UPI000614B910|nr:PREDICTED: alkylated DNA repair protein alkB homolog 1 [Megachile rotundata]XP_012150589.1 PREDICTED: alkylated DNA repair protein alkB homolog 1 [Megachile rotundata]
MMFKNSFKYYRSRSSFSDLKDVIDLNKPNCSRVIRFKGNLSNTNSEHKLGLKPVKDWEVYEFLDIPGLIFIKNPFTNYGQRYWIIQCIKHYSRKPYKINLDAHNVLEEDKTWWDTCFGESDQVIKLIPKLRWATLGYHHDWDTKLYSETCKTKMPTELTALTSVLAQTLGFMNFKAEAAIVNYYRMNSSLSGHTDHSEINTEAPLFSISFGQTAIFLIGGLTQDDAANAMYLRSGDIVIMSGNSRLRYHGVPKILPADTIPWDDEEANDNSDCCTWDENDWNKAKTYILKARININVRQVLKPGQLALP